MSTTIHIPMNEETRIALEDVFMDNENMDARKFVFDSLKQACMDAKRSVRNNITPINQRQEDGAMKQEEYSLKGINLDKFALPLNESWLPKGLETSDNKPIELKLGDNTMKNLKTFGNLVILRHERYNIGEDKYLEEQKLKMKTTMPNPEQYDRWLKQQDSIREDRLGIVPTCLEQALHTSIWPSIQQKIEQSDGLIFEKEYEEIYKKTEDKPKLSK